MPDKNSLTKDKSILIAKDLKKLKPEKSRLLKKYQHSQCCSCTGQSPQQFFESKNLLSVYKDTTYKRRTRQISNKFIPKNKNKNKNKTND